MKLEILFSHLKRYEESNTEITARANKAIPMIKTVRRIFKGVNFAGNKKLKILECLPSFQAIVKSPRRIKAETISP